MSRMSPMRTQHLILVFALLVPAALSAAGPAAAPAAPTAPPSWLDGNTACARQASVVALPDGQGLQAAAAMPDTPFARRQEKSGSCPVEVCDDLCNNVVCQCGGYAATQCAMTFNGTCRSICYCFPC